MPGDTLRAHDKVNAPGGQGVSRHFTELRRRCVLRKSDSPFRFDRLETLRTIGTSPGQDDPARATLAIVRQRVKEEVDRRMLAFRAPAQPQDPV